MIGKPHQNWHQRYQDKMSRSDYVALKITNFAGTLRFIYIHIVWWSAWFLVNSSLFHVSFDRYPYNLLTMILSLEAILLGTLIMIGQNLQSTRDKIQAEHQHQHVEQELTALTAINNTQLAILKEMQKLSAKK